MKILKTIFISFLIIFSFSFCGCQLFKGLWNKTKAITQCKFELVNVTKKVSFTEKTNNIWNYVIEVKLNAINNSTENLSLGRYQFDLYADNKFITCITTNEPIIMNALSTNEVIAKAIISPSGSIGILLKKLFGKSIEYRIKGIFYIRMGYIDYPLELDLIRFLDTAE